MLFYSLAGHRLYLSLKLLAPSVSDIAIDFYEHKMIYYVIKYASETQERSRNRTIDMRKFDNNFSFPERLQEVKNKGFSWPDLERFFPFGFLGMREGEYIQIINAVLDALPDQKQRSLLLDFIDAQWCLFIEQKWIAREFSADENLFLVENHQALARLQIGSNIRSQKNLICKDGRRAMMSLKSDETLFDRIIKGK